MRNDSALYHGYSKAMSEAGPTPRFHWREGLLLFALALAVRLALLPFATLDTGDTAARIWLGWRWADDPFLMTSGLWGPLHFYLIGTVLRFWSDPVWAPIALHVAIGSIIPVIACRMTLDLFGNRRSAIAAGLIFAMYPAAIAVSLGARAETPFMLFFGLGLLGLVQAWRPDGRISHALLAGLAITLASMLRYEAWLLLPFLTLLLVKKPKLAAAFLITAMIHPVIWMIGSALAYGNPLHSLLATATWTQDILARELDTRLVPGLGRIARLAGRTAVELTIPIAVLMAVGAYRCLRQKRIESVWLIPPLALFLIFAVSAFRDTMTIKSGYTTTIGLLLIPFIACAFEWLNLERWSRARCAAAATALLAAMGVFMLEPAMNRLPGGSRLSSNPVPTIPDEDNVRQLRALIDRAELKRGSDGYIADFFGLLTTPYVAWQTRLHPGNICRTPGAANRSLSSEQLEVFLLANRSGVLVTRPDSRLTAHLELESDRAGTLAGIPLRLEPIGTMDWKSRDPARNFGTMTVSRYRVIGMDHVPAREPIPCTNSCPISLCRDPAAQQE